MYGWKFEPLTIIAHFFKSQFSHQTLPSLENPFGIPKWLSLLKKRTLGVPIFRNCWGINISVTSVAQKSVFPRPEDILRPSAFVPLWLKGWTWMVWSYSFYVLQRLGFSATARNHQWTSHSTRICIYNKLDYLLSIFYVILVFKDLLRSWFRSFEGRSEVWGPCSFSQSFLRYSYQQLGISMVTFQHTSNWTASISL